MRPLGSSVVTSFGLLHDFDDRVGESHGAVKRFRAVEDTHRELLPEDHHPDLPTMTCDLRPAPSADQSEDV